MNDIIQEKLQSYNCETKEDEENAISEITQEIALYALAKAGFFEKAFFQGGTCLRIVHGLDRFSEDLDFALRSPALDFDLAPYLNKVIETMNVYGYKIEVSGEDKANNFVKARFLKDDSIKRLIKFEHGLDLRNKIQIKVEVDILPPPNATNEVNYLDFPVDFMITTHDLPSLLAGKCHALLCRNFTKGRDWYDYLWYIKKGVVINVKMFQEAINQLGPWKDKNTLVTKSWLDKELKKKISQMSWEEVKKDVMRFIKPNTKETLKLWSKDFFIKKTDKFISLL
ncbi:MAG: nucleotidyl transferase AbiEii/AbiGii toxin family protein [Bacteriovoracaceae bacterium]|nr:nucleotidyl transferase AbiEii/AbiGii toxin family protein [Bacteriovoracaceae bacterium]